MGKYTSKLGVSKKRIISNERLCITLELCRDEIAAIACIYETKTDRETVQFIIENNKRFLMAYELGRFVKSITPAPTRNNEIIRFKIEL
jgi:hypothetical protein